MTIVQFDLVEHYDRPVGYRILADSIDEIAGDAVRKYQQRCKTQIERSGADMSGVNAELAKNPALSALRIDVDTQDGVVTLKGPALDEKSRARAGVLAGAPDGVRSVDNQLQLGGASNS